MMEFFVSIFIASVSNGAMNRQSAFMNPAKGSPVDAMASIMSEILSFFSWLWTSSTSTLAARRAWASCGLLMLATLKPDASQFWMNERKSDLGGVLVNRGNVMSVLIALSSAISGQRNPIPLVGGARQVNVLRLHCQLSWPSPTQLFVSLRAWLFLPFALPS